MLWLSIVSLFLSEPWGNIIFMFGCTYIYLFKPRQHSLLCLKMFLEFSPHDMRDESLLFHFIFSVGISSSISILNKNCERRVSSGAGCRKVKALEISDITLNTVFVVSFRFFFYFNVVQSQIWISFFIFLPL